MVKHIIEVPKKEIEIPIPELKTKPVVSCLFTNNKKFYLNLTQPISVNDSGLKIIEPKTSLINTCVGVALVPLDFLNDKSPFKLASFDQLANLVAEF